MQRSFICGLVLYSLPMLVHAQERKLTPGEVPASVISGAHKSFPQARVSGWSQEAADGKITYEASVSDADGKRDAVFSQSGALLAVEQSIPVASLPIAVKNSVTAKFPHAVLRKAEKIVHDGVIDYEVELAKAARKEVTFSADGKILKEE